MCVRARQPLLWGAPAAGGAGMCVSCAGWSYGGSGESVLRHRPHSCPSGMRVYRGAIMCGSGADADCSRWCRVSRHDTLHMGWWVALARDRRAAPHSTRLVAAVRTWPALHVGRGHGCRQMPQRMDRMCGAPQVMRDVWPWHSICGRWCDQCAGFVWGGGGGGGEASVVHRRAAHRCRQRLCGLPRR